MRSERGDVLQLALGNIFYIFRESEISVCDRLEAPPRSIRPDCPHHSVEVEHRYAVVEVPVSICCDIIRESYKSDLVMINDDPLWLPVLE